MGLLLSIWGINAGNVLLGFVAMCAIFITLCIMYDSKSWDKRGGLLELRHKWLAVLCGFLMVLAPLLLLLYSALVPLDISGQFLRLFVRLLIFAGLNLVAGFIAMLTVTAYMFVYACGPKKQSNAIQTS